MTTINDLVVSNSFSPDDKLPMWSNANGVTRGLPISVLTDSFLTQDDIALLAASSSVETFISDILPNPGNLPTFTAGVSLTLPLAHVYASAKNIDLHFDGTFQGPENFSLVLQTLTFSTPIPVGVSNVYVRGGAVRVIGAPSDGTVGTSAIVDGAVTDAKVSATSSLFRRIHDFMSVKDFGAKGDGVTDDTSAINASFQAAYAAKHALFFPAGTYMVSDTTAAGYALLNPGVSMFGDGHNNTVIAPLSSMPVGSDFMKISPPAGAVLDFMYLRDFLIFPGASGTKYGQRAIIVSTQLTSNAGGIKFSGVYCAPGNAVSMEWDNDSTANPQGCPSNSTFENCAFWEGTKFVQAGDSIRFRDCVLRSTAGSGRIGVNFTAVNGAGGTSACLDIENCNGDCDGGFVTIFSGFKPRIANNNIEQSAGAGSPSGSVVDIDGGSVACNGAEVVGNAIGIFGTATVNSAIRINKASNPTIEDNRLTAGVVVANGIFVTANSTRTNIGGGNELSTNFTTPINNVGVFTSGIRYPLTLLNGFTNVGLGAATASVSRNKEGKVQLEGLINNAGVPNNTVIFQLPPGFFPPSVVDFLAFGVIGGSISPVKIEVSNSTGNVTMFSSGTVTQISLSGLSFDTLSYFSSNV